MTVHKGLFLLILSLLLITGGGVSVKGRHQICREPIVRIPCRERRPQYAFNAYTYRCEPLGYGVCAGSQNRFDSLRECRYVCEQSIFAGIMME
ncbi:hypothetical protein AAHC03_018972 [Spirometra sp. Aus1]